jgi:hypothetical protein
LNVLLRWLVICCAVFLVSAFLGFCPAAVHASEGFQPISSEELRMTSEPLAPGAPAIILYRQVDRDDNAPFHEDNYVRIKILTEEGRKYANVEIPFVKGGDDVMNIKARTIKPDGSVATIDGNIFEQSIVKTKALRILAKTFTLPDVQVGSVIEYSFTYDLKGYLYDSHWILNSELFTKHARFSLTKNPRLSLWWNWHALPPGTPEPKEGPGHVVRMEVSNIPAFQREDFMPPENELKSRVDFVYGGDFRPQEGLEPRDDIRFENSTQAVKKVFWKRVGQTWNDYLETFVGKRGAMEKAAAQLVSPNDSPEVKLRKLYDRVRQIRNTSYELEKTAQEEKRDKEKSAQNIEDVWKRGYGNITAINWLYLGLLRAAGFEAYGCWVSDRRNYFFTPETMQSTRLNASVVLVKLNNKDLYLDPGEEFTPFGMLYWTLTGVEGLRLDKDGGTWIRTTVPESSESKTERQARLKLSDAGDLDGKLTVTYTGLEAMHYRFEARHSDDLARKKLLENEVKEQIPAAAEAELTNKPDWSNSEIPLIAEFNVRVTGWASNAGKRRVIPTGIFTSAERHMFESANRIHPLYLEYPFVKEDRITIDLPPGWQASNIPSVRSQDAPAVGYNLKVERSDGTLQFTRKLKEDFLMLDPKYYPAIRGFFQFVRASDEQQIVLQPGTVAASN